VLVLKLFGQDPDYSFCNRSSAFVTMIGVVAPEDLMWVVVLGAISMAYMAWGIGANDVANAFGPAFGARSLTVKQACIIAAFCEAGGAILMGGSVSDTIRKGMMDIKLYEGDDGRVLIMVGMTSVLIAAATWLLVASKFGLPVSTTHSAVGGVIAFAITSKGYGSVKWDKIGMIVASWFISPVMSGFMAAFLWLSLYHLVLKHPNSLQRAKLAAPVLVFLVTFVVSLFTVYKGGKGLGLNKTTPEVAVGVSIAISLPLAAISYPFVTWWAGKVLAQNAKEEAKGEQVKDGIQETSVAPTTYEVDCAADTFNTDGKPADTMPVVLADKIASMEEGGKKAVAKEGVETEPEQTQTEKMFTGLVVIIAGFFSLAHGANDVANSVGPFGAVLSAFDGPLQKKSEIPLWVFVGAGVMIVVGLATYGVHVMRTIGGKITAMTPPHAFCVNFASTIVVLIATRAGIPVSTTHASVGAVLGVGIANGLRKVDWKVMSKVFLSWILTLPIVGITAAGIFALLLPAVVQVPFA